MLFQIPLFNLHEFKAEMGKLAKRGEKLGCTGIGWTEVRRYRAPVREDWSDGSSVRTIDYVEVDVTGDAPRFEGWSLIGRLDFAAVPGATIRAMVPGHECPPDFHEVESGRCDHCGTARRRNDSFLCRHEDGEVVVVGRNCLRDFLGHNSPESIAAAATLLASLSGLGGGDEGGFGGRYRGDDYTAHGLLTLTSFVCRTYGWVPRSASATDKPPTSSRVLELLTPSRNPEIERARRAALAQVSVKDAEHAQAAIEWAATINATNDYTHNLKAVLSALTVDPKMIGIAVSGIAAYDRAMASAREQVKRAAESKSTHRGIIGERLTIDGEIVMVRGCETQWGTSTVIKFVDQTGSVFTWFATGAKDVRQGERVTVVGTVKKHDEYRGELQTVLTRCKIN